MVMKIHHYDPESEPAQRRFGAVDQKWLPLALMLFAGWLLAHPPVAAGDEHDLAQMLDGVSLSGQWFLAYNVVDSDEERFNEFKLKRGYVTVQKAFSDDLSARVTQDIAVDHEGDGEGDVEIRLKYLYLKYHLPDYAILSKPYIELGLVHRPWLDFEQKVNPYRVQGTMYLERYRILRSADYGITVGALLGGEMDEAYRSEVRKAYPGRFGSFAIGLYNGGGYEAIERNNNKLVETRLTLRPMPDLLPGLQMSWVGGFGKGNSETSPELTYHAAFVSFQAKRFLLTGTFYAGRGDVNGLEVDSAGQAYDQDGWSVFADVGVPISNLRVFGRYDLFDSEVTTENWYQRRSIAGISYRIHRQVKMLVDYDRIDVDLPSIGPSSTIEMAVEIKY